MSQRYDEIMKNKPYLPYRMGYLTEEMVSKAERELGETEEVRKRAILELRKMVEEEPKMVCGTEDEFMLQYLRARKFNVKKAFNLLQNFLQVKSSHPELYSECDVPNLRGVFRTRCLSCLPYRDEDGCVILILQMYKWDTEEFAMPPILKALTCAVMACIEDPATQVCGVRAFLDVKGANFRQVRCLTPRYMHLLSRALRNCLPVRFKSIHIYNESVFFQYIWSVLKLFLTEKIKKRVHFHGDNQKNLHKAIPKVILSSEYGGDYTQYNTSDWYINEMERFYERYAHLHTFAYKE